MWWKPLYCYASPFERFLWLDADCVVLESLNEAFDELDRGPLLVRETQEDIATNPAEFYRRLPLQADVSLDGVTVNNGVFGLDRFRDFELLAAWAWATQWAAEQSDRERIIRFWDQGALLWTIHRLGRQSEVRADLRWNMPARRTGGLIVDALRKNCSLIDELRYRHPGASVVHWFGPRKLPPFLLDEVARRLLPYGLTSPRLPDAPR